MLTRPEPRNAPVTVPTDLGGGTPYGLRALRDEVNEVRNSSEGSRNHSVTWQIRHLRCPSCVHAGSPMPPFASLGERNIRQIAVFLSDSR